MRFLKPSNWWIALLLLFVVGFSGVAFMGVKTYQEAPPIPDFVAPDGDVVVSHDEILAGQAVFQQKALMDHGSMFGDGAGRGPDYTADALHTLALAMTLELRRELEARGSKASDLELAGIREQVKTLLKVNAYDARTNAVSLAGCQARAVPALVAHFSAYFGDGAGSMKPAKYLTDQRDLRNLTAFFFWGAWTCAAVRPGSEASFTHNWPFDVDAGNAPSSPVLFWSVFGALGLIVGLGGVLYVHGRLAGAADATREHQVVSVDFLGAFRPTPTQRATYKFFATAVVLFLLQVLAGVLTVHDFVGFTKFAGVDLAELLPITVVRSWHIQLSLLWITACWVGASIFVLPFLTRTEPRGQLLLVNALFRLIVILVLGSCLGILLGPLGKLGGWWRELGHQGWEFVELGRVWQGLLLGCFVLWAVILFRGTWSTIRAVDPWTLPNALVATVVAISVLFCAGFVAGPKTNFVIADFWRWCVIHMWAEAFFEVFTTIVVATFMVLMGLTSRAQASRVVYVATLLFLGSGLLGISHNFYWNAKPVVTLALGSVFSTLQVVPLVLLAAEAWRFRALPRQAVPGFPRTPIKSFGQSEAFLFLLGVNFWNFMGAGVLGFIINLPIVNYYEHGTTLTVNHGHAALMGVYGNLSIASTIFVARYLLAPGAWSAPLLRLVFWSLNLGLALMVLLDLFPAGVIQLDAVLSRGLWYARSEEFIQGDAFQTVTWMRIVGGAIFTLGGVLPLTWFMVSRLRSLKASGPSEPSSTDPSPTVASLPTSAVDAVNGSHPPAVRSREATSCPP